MNNKIKAGLITLSIIGFILLLFYGIMCHGDIMIMIGVCLGIAGMSVVIIAGIYMIYKEILNSME